MRAYVCHCRGARHGLTLSGKLARIQQQEAAAAISKAEVEGPKVTANPITSHKGKERKGAKRKYKDAGEDRTQKLRTKKRKLNN